MHPSRAGAWEWDEGNEGELAHHGISPEEVEQVFFGRAVFVPNKKHRAGDWKMVGMTKSGRRLTVVIRFDPRRSTVRPITGWDATAGERTRYLRRG